MWQTLSTKVLLDHPRVKVVEDEIVLHTGSLSTYLRYETKASSVAIIVRREDGKILLQKEYSYPQKVAIYQLPGGGVPLSEDIEDGAQRELMEECGYRARKMTKLGVYYPDNRRTTMMQNVFLAEDLVEDKLAEDHEEVFEFFWLSEDEIDELIKKGEIVNASLLASWSLYKVMATSSRNIAS